MYGDDLKKYLENTIENSNNIEEILNSVYSAIKEQTRLYSPLESYGYGLLADYFEDYLEDDFYFENEYDLANDLFNYPRYDGTLTYSTLQAERELLANYDPEDISEMDMFKYCRNTEQMHIEACEEAFRGAFADYKNYIAREFPKLNDKEKMLLTCYAISDDKELGLYKDLDNQFCKDTLKKALAMNKEEAELFLDDENGVLEELFKDEDLEM